MNERAFGFIRTNRREGKPRTRVLTEIRGPYYYCFDAVDTISQPGVASHIECTAILSEAR